MAKKLSGLFDDVKFFKDKKITKADIRRRKKLIKEGSLVEWK